MSVGLITPGRVGEIARIGSIDKKRRIEELSLVIWDKIFDLLAVLILALGGFYFFFWNKFNRNFRNFNNLFSIYCF
jgi:hypothetical protein